MLDTPHGWNRNFKPLILGFALSLLLIFASYFLAAGQPFSGSPLSFSLSGICVAMALVQLVFFLHLGIESKPHWYLITFLFMVLILVIVIGGSLWIMYNLNYRMMPGVLPGREIP